MTDALQSMQRYYLVTLRKRLAKVVRVYAIDEDDAKRQANAGMWDKIVDTSEELGAIIEVALA